MVSVLLTRPLARQAKTAAKLEAMGHEVVAEPLLHLEDLDTPTPNGPFAAVLLTSAHAAAHAARAIPEANRKDCLVLATGQATAKAALAAGFETVHHVGGDATDLANTVNSATYQIPLTLPLLWPRAETIARDLADLIERQSVSWVVYRMVAATAFSDSTRRRLVEGQIDAVLLTSPRIAQTFATLFQQLPRATDVPTIFAMSGAIRDELPANLGQRTHVSMHPNEAALLTLLATDGG
ncbi:MAG: uroporphyrinogen-III synthase [Pseudomonadota bacterium]